MRYEVSRIKIVVRTVCQSGAESEMCREDGAISICAATLQSQIMQHVHTSIAIDAIRALERFLQAGGVLVVGLDDFDTLLGHL